MNRTIRHVTGLGAMAALVGALLAAGCGVGPKPIAPGMRADVMQAKRSGYAPQFVPRPKVRNLARPLPGTTMHGLEDDPKPAPPAAPAPGGMKPLPKPTAVPAPAAPGGAREPDEVDEFLTIMQNFGYDGNRKQLQRAIRAATYAYPVNDPVKSPWGWSPEPYNPPSRDPKVHWAWWQKTLPPGETPTYEEYLRQSLYIAQNKFNVVYYVWMSKQEDPANNRPQLEPPYNNTAPDDRWVNLNKYIPVVKGIHGGGWLVEISPDHLILDYLRVEENFLRDYNHLVPIPEALYY